MGGRRQRTVLNEPAHARHLRGRDPTEGPGLAHTQSTQPTIGLSGNHLLAEFSAMLQALYTTWFT